MDHVFSNTDCLVDDANFTKIISEELFHAVMSYNIPSSPTNTGPIDEEEQAMMFPNNPMVGNLRKRTMTMGLQK